MPTENNQYQEVYLVIVFGVSIFFLLVGLMVYIILKAVNRKLKHAKEKADLQSAFEKNLLQSKIEIQEQAFNEISRELHDNLGQQLSLAKLNLSTLKEIANVLDQEKIETTRELISDSIYQIRSISKTLLGEKVSSIGIVESIKKEAARINKTGVIDISVEANLQSIFLDNQKEVILFRIVQEALNNVIKHAAATIVVIKLENQNDALKISIQDNGKGFILVGDSNNGIGLMNMRNRAETIGAKLNIASAPNDGTCVEIIIEKPTDN